MFESNWKYVTTMLLRKLELIFSQMNSKGTNLQYPVTWIIKPWKIYFDMHLKLF